jgi:hypothetical protein
MPTFEEWEKQKYGDSTTPSLITPTQKQSFEEWEKQKYGGETLTPSLAPQLPTSTPGSQLFTSQDLPLLTQTLKGFVPGMGAIEELKRTPKPATYPEQLKALAGITGREAKRIGTGIPTFLASAAMRPILSVSELLGGPKKIGPWTSGQEEYRQAKEAGAGEVVSTAMPIASQALSMLGLKRMKGVQQKHLETSLGKKTAQTLKKELPKEEVSEFDIPQEFRTAKGPMAFIKRSFKWAGLDDKVEQYGSGGKKTVDLVYRMEAKTSVYANQPLNLWKSITKGMNEKQKILLRDVVEGKTKAPTPAFNQKAIQTRQLLDWMFEESNKRNLNLPYGKEYFPRRLSQTGSQYFKVPSNWYEALQKIAEAKEMGMTEAGKIYNQYIKPLGISKKAFTEFERKLTPQVLKGLFGKETLPKEFRASPDFEMKSYATSLAKRWAATEEWGKDWGKINAAVEQAGFEKKIGRDLAAELRDRAYGTTIGDKELMYLGNKFSRGIMVNLLGPQTGYLQNTFQFLNAIPRFGVRSAIKGFFKGYTESGKKYATELGQLEPEVKSFASWTIKNISGFKTEKFGINRTALSALDYIDRNFNALKKNPNNIHAQNALNSLKINWKPHLKIGSLPPIEKALGASNGVRATMFLTYLTSAPKNLGSENLFRRFAWQQSKMVFDTLARPDAPLIKRLGRMGAFLLASSVAGEAHADVSALISKRERPENLALRGLENITHAGGLGIAMDLPRMLTYPGGLASYWAGVPASYAGKQIFTGYQALAGKTPDTRTKNLLKFIFGMPYIPAGSSIGRALTSTPK